MQVTGIENENQLCKTYAILMVRTAAGKQKNTRTFVVAVLCCQMKS